MAVPNYDGASRIGQRVASATGKLISAIEEFERSFAAADAIAYSANPPNFTLLEKNVEKPDAPGNDFAVSVGGGETFRNNINGVRSHLADAGFRALVTKLDKGY